MIDRIILIAAMALYVLFGDADRSLLPFAMIGLVSVTRETLKDTTVGFNTLFNKFFDSTEISAIMKIAMTVPSTTSKEVYKWLGKIPGLREWIGGRAVHALEAHGYTIVNKDFESTVGVDRNDIEDDTLGIYAPLFSALGENAKLHPGQLIAAILISGEVDLCFDNKAFFAADHPNGDQPVFSNLITGSALTATNYGAGRSKMMELVNEAGNPLNIVPDALIVPPQLEETGRTILNAELIGGGNTNVWRNSAELIMVPELAASATSWYLAKLKGVIKPIIFQERKKPEFVAKDDPEDENVFDRKEFLYGVDSRANAGYGLPHLMQKHKA